MANESKTIDVVDPNSGDVETIPQSQARDYLSSGYTVDTPEAAAARAEEEKFGSTGQEIATGVEGFARGATLGLSDEAETGLGISTPENISKRREINPNAASVGEGAGLIGSLLVPGLDEAEGLSRGASLLTELPRATEAIGKGAGTFTKKLLQGLGAKPEGIATKALSSAADMAAQSEIYNAAQNVDETHLAGGNMEQAAENALANSGDALALGAGLGAAIPVAGLGLKLAASKAGHALSGVGNYIKDKLPAIGESATNAYAKVASPLSGVSESAIKDDLAGAFTPEGAAAREKKLAEVTPDERDKMQKEFQDHLQNAFTATNDAVKQGFKELRPAETARLTEGVPIGPASDNAASIGQKMRERIAAMRAEPEIYSPAVVRRLEIAERGFTDKLINKGVDSTVDLFEMMNDLKSKAIDPIAKLGGVLSVSEREAVKEVRDIRAMLKGHLENSELYGEAAARQAAFNDAYSSWRSLVGDEKKRGVFQKFFLDKSPTKSGGQQLVVNPTKINSYFGKIASARDAAHTQALNDFLESSHNLVAELGHSAGNVGIDNFDAKGMQNLLSAVKSNAGSSAERLQYASKNRAMSNAPFVSSSPINIAHRGGLATAGAIIGGAPGAAVGAAISKVHELLTNPHEAMRALSMLEGLTMKTGSKISNGIKTALRTGSKAVGAGVEALRPLEAYEVARHEKHADYHKELQDHVNDNVDPQATLGKFHTALNASAISNNAPNVAKIIAEKQSSTKKYLWSQFPKNPSPMPSFSGESTWRPSSAEMDEYRSKENIAKRPMLALEHLRSGVLSDNDVEVMQQCWPSILSQMRESAAEQLASGKHELTPKMMGQLSILFSRPIDDSQDPELTQSIQGVWSSQNSQKPAAPSKAEEGDTKLSNDTKTASEKLQS